MEKKILVTLNLMVSDDDCEDTMIDVMVAETMNEFNPKDIKQHIDGLTKQLYEMFNIE